MPKENRGIYFPTDTVQEGKVKMTVPRLKAFVRLPSDYAPSKAPVFYNPVMELNRDISVIALQAYQKTVSREVSVCEPLTGCGVRGIRYAKEVKGVENVVIADISEKAFQLAKHNVQANGLGKRVTVKNKEANSLLSGYSAPRKRFDAVDIDPFGSPVPYLDSAIRALRDGGLLALTATDMAPLCGVHPKACIRKYGGKPLRTEYCHELAVRLFAGCLASTAARQDIGICLLFSHVTDHYARVYATIAYGAKRADESLKNTRYMLHCFHCFHRETTKELYTHSGKCCECGSKMSYAGPLWLGKISDAEMCSLMKEEAKTRMFKLQGKLKRILTSVKDEVDAPITYYVVDKLCDALNLPVPPVKSIVEALRTNGYKAVLTHFDTTGIKTDASAMKVKEVLRQVLNET